MKVLPLFIVSWTSLFWCCNGPAGTATHATDTTKSIIIDSTLRITAGQKIKLLRSTNFSNFITPLKIRYYDNGQQADSNIQNNYRMSSWYSNHKDTIGLVAHFGGLGTQALLIRFIGGRPTVWLFLAAHEVEHPGLFRINKTDSFSNQLEVPPIRYQLKLSEIPDTTNKQVIFGYIDMESGEYFDKRDPDEEKLKVRMKFYFRSQYRKFDF